VPGLKRQFLNVWMVSLSSSGLPVLALLIVDSGADGAGHELRPGGIASQVRKLRAGHIGADLQTLSWQAL